MQGLEYELNVVQLGTGSAIWSDTDAAALRRDVGFPAVAHGSPRIGVLDFGNIVPTPAALCEFLVPLGEGVRSGRYGTFALFVSAPDAATREFVQYISAARDFPVFLVPNAGIRSDATPAGELTPTERATLDLLSRSGGTLTAADFAAGAGIGVTAAGNRQVNLSRRGYIHRIPQSGRAGDLFLDPRAVNPRPVAT